MPTKNYDIYRFVGLCWL